MQSTPPNFSEWHNPHPDEIGDTWLDFLHQLTGPTWIDIKGKDTSRSRAIVTLLHGNEPSGFKAVHRMLADGIVPATNLGIFLASVNAASLQPPFSHRFLPEEMDMNRCFNPPFDTDQRKLAAALLEKLAQTNPEAVIDAHNTSAHSQVFAVATNDRPSILQLTGMFTRKLVVLDLQLGTLIEQQGFGPVITVEFGGVMDPRADRMALETLHNFAISSTLFDTEPPPISILRHPHRLEIDPGYELHYSSTLEDNADITIFNTIDQLNFSRIEAGTQIGWSGPRGLAGLRINSADGDDLLDDYFRVQDGLIVTTRPVTLFMATTDAYIARKDCLLYLTPHD